MVVVGESQVDVAESNVFGMPDEETVCRECSEHAATRISFRAFRDFSRRIFHRTAATGATAKTTPQTIGTNQPTREDR
jgi:hypothetical protein